MTVYNITIQAFKSHGKLFLSEVEANNFDEKFGKVKAFIKEQAIIQKHNKVSYHTVTSPSLKRFWQAEISECSNRIAKAHRSIQ